MTADLASYTWLISPDAQPWLELAAAGGEPLPTLTTNLRRRLSPAQTHLVLEQVELRRRASAKFSQAARMFFTRRSLEQSTSEMVAAWKAMRYPARAGREPLASIATTADLCCGVGGDLIALAARGAAVGVERDPVVALLARANLAALGLTHAKVRCEDVRTFAVEDAAAWHLDPDRRNDQRRIAQPELAEPGLEVIDHMLERNPHGAVKMAPAAHAPVAWREASEREWISEQGECKQQVAWFGRLAQTPGRRRATAIARSGAAATFVGDEGRAAPVATRMRRYLYEPDAAVLAAGLAGALAEQRGLEAVAAGVAYFTSNERQHDPLLAAFEVEEVMPFDRKRLRSLLRERGIGRLEIKKRGLEIDIPRLHAELRVAGHKAATLLIAPLATGAAAIVARRIDGPSS